MDVVIYGVFLLYLPLLPYTLMVMGVPGLMIALYKHRARPLVYSLLVALPVNVIVALIYLINN